MLHVLDGHDGRSGKERDVCHARQITIVVEILIAKIGEVLDARSDTHAIGEAADHTVIANEGHTDLQDLAGLSRVYPPRS